MNPVLERLKKSRQQSIEISGITITYRRPTDLEMGEIDGDLSIRETLKRFIVDWVAKENDLVAGGTPELVPFSIELFVEWVEDHPEAWRPLVQGITKSYKEYRERVDDELKKQSGG